MKNLFINHLTILNLKSWPKLKKPRGSRGAWVGDCGGVQASMGMDDDNAWGMIHHFTRACYLSMAARPLLDYHH